LPFSWLPAVQFSFKRSSHFSKPYEQSIKYQRKNLMKFLICSMITILISIFTNALPQTPAGAPVDPSLRPFLFQFETGINSFINGDPALWKQHASRRDDVTIMGGWGAYKKGWKEANSQYDWAVARFQESGARVNVEYLSSGVSGDLAYTVSIERSEVRLVDQDKPAPMALRVTHLFRKEDGGWKLVHRHADPLVGRTEAATVLRKSND
jgi:ketosteroid isomerase-like protein